jgi:hypothetical protein
MKHYSEDTDNLRALIYWVSFFVLAIELVVVFFNADR